MFNFYVVLAGHDMVTDTDTATTCRRKFKAPSVQTVQKLKELSKSCVLTGKQFEDFRRKKNISSLDPRSPWNTRPLNATNEDGPRNQEESNSTKLEK